MADYLGVKDVSAELGVTPQKVRDWIRHDGAPAFKDRSRWAFKEDELYEWLIKTGKAQPNEEDEEDSVLGLQPILVSRREVAERFGTSVRVIASWLEMPGFPGRPGKAGTGPKSKGFFPLWEIAKWVYHHPTLKLEVPEDLLPHVEVIDSETSKNGPVPKNSRDRLTSARASRAELELANLRGELIEVEKVARFYQRQVAGAATIAKSIPSQIGSLLPSELDDELVATVQEVVNESINNMMMQLAELNEGDQDEDDSKDNSA